MKLKKEFYQQDTEVVARQLLGKTLVRVYKGQRISGVITETEAYLGLIDKAAHSYHGKVTERTKVMYMEGGHAYVFMIYGMYYCFNVITRTTRQPEAVLIRALQPKEGLQLMHKFRKTDDERKLTTGPGKLGQALKIDKSLNALPLSGQQIYIEDAANLKASQIVTRPRIGVDYAEEAVEWPLRFYIKDCPYISKK